MKKILLVEDDELIRTILQETFCREGYEVTSSTDGEEGMELFFSFNPDIILLDIMLPKKNGIEVCRLLRSGIGYNSVPIILISGLGETDDIIKGLSVGANDYITKPFNSQELLARVKSQLLLREINDEERKLKEKVIENSVEGVVITDAHATIKYVNPAFVKVTGYGSEEAIGKSPNILKSGQHDEVFYKEMWDSLSKKGEWKGEIWNRRKNGEIYPQWATIAAIRDSKNITTHYAAVFYDMTEIKKSQKEIEYRAYYDFLTDIPNRRLFLDRLKQAIGRAKREERKVGVLFIDLDNFKHINDCFGHGTGDMVLKEVAKRLIGCAREVDTVSRLAGDEFSIILDELENEDEAGIVANRVLKALTEPFHHKTNDLFSSVSIGIAIYPLNGETADDILKNADMAMYHVKELGKNNFHYFNDSLNEKALKRRELETGLRTAISNHQLVVYYQPKIDLKSGKIASMEALARWPKSNGEIISPAEFIPIAESTGLIVLLDELILQKSCSFLKKIQNTYFTDLTVSVNLSTKGLENLHLTQNVLKTVCKFGLDPRHVELEVTESMIIRNVESAIEILREFREKGFNISIDDFGTGYSSLSYLTKFPISTLKIDKAFVNGLASDINSQSIAKAIVSMAHAMEMKVVAEGVETQAQLDFLRSIDCDQIQGYIFSKPLPENEMMELLKRKREAMML